MKDNFFGKLYYGKPIHVTCKGGLRLRSAYYRCIQREMRQRAQLIRKEKVNGK